MAPAAASLRSFLAKVRAALCRREATAVLLAAAAALLVVALLAPVTAALLAGPRSTALAVKWVGGLAAFLILVTAVVVGVFVPRRRYAGDPAMARWVGRKVPPLASDLLSAVELTAGGRARGAPSPLLVDALLEATARTVSKLEPRALIPRRALRQATLALAGAIAIQIAAVFFAPQHLAHGWSLLLDTPELPFGGADLATEPLVADIAIRLDYPPYTGRPATTLSSATGDLRALPGTVVTLEARLLDPAKSAGVLIERGGELSPLDGTIEDGRLSVRFETESEARYRFTITEPSGKKRIEGAPRVIEIEPDLAPVVELITPGDELDITAMSRLELAYVIEDDFGIAKAELVWQSGTDIGRRELPLSVATRRAQGKMVWDLAEAGITANTSYFVEVTDNDAVRGPNIGRSKTYTLRVFSTREKHEQLLARQEEAARRLLEQLGERLVLPSDQPAKRDELAQRGSELAIELGALATASESDVHADKGLTKALVAMRGRLEKALRAEAKLLGSERKEGRQRAAASRFAATDKALIAELEDDVLVLADWLDRERLESMLDVQDEIAGHRRRLGELLDQYAKTNDPRLLAEIERELRAIDSGLAELGRKRAGMPEDVLDRFVNRDALAAEGESDCYREAKRLLDAKRPAEAAAKLAECNAELDRSSEALEAALEELRGSRFSDEQRGLDELLDQVTDLAGEQREIGAETDQIFDRYAKRADEMMREMSRDARSRLASTIDRIRDELASVPDPGLTPFAREELDIATRRLDDLKEMLGDGDLAEALGMARQAKNSLDTLATELETALQEDPDSPWAQDTAGSLDAVERALPPLKKVVEELQQLTPSPDQILSADDKRDLERLRRRQGKAAEAAGNLIERARQLAPQIPGNAGEELSKQVSSARERMDRAGEHMKKRDASAARLEARAAADALEKARSQARSAARLQQSSGAGRDDQPIRIPGADEYRAPLEFREDILEAMKRKPPDGWNDLVRRYYEELIK